MQVVKKFKFSEADPHGNYVPLGKKFVFKFGLRELMINKEVVPFRKVIELEFDPSSVALVYLGDFQIRKVIFVTTNSPLGREKKLGAFHEMLAKEVNAARSRGYPEQDLVEAGPNVCEACGRQDGHEVAVCSVFSVFYVSSKRDDIKVLCPKHIALQVLPRQLSTGLMGWWGIFGFFWTFGALFRNAASLAKTKLGLLSYLIPLAFISLPTWIIYVVATR